ncbi:sugar kinase [Acrocarpospora phusangensis]|uniref:Sugar kinase n=1 Tax=Acrocarpospora phusangensis TaxID=1070424 RepID=A0A919USU4_9ACTN|nr:ROK family protein [Acrocarpospora phusangensis]GIH29612.1 sugar kinase [Acrocarpospora phusangensis]
MSYVVALDVGGTSMKGGLVTLSGEVTVFPGRPTGRERGADAAVATINSYVSELADAGTATFGQAPAGVGLAVPGIVSATVALYSANIGWRDVPVAAFVPDGLPACLGHDVRTGGLAESVFGAGREVSDFLFLPLGTGIAAAVVVGGEPYGGANGWGGEIGHTPVWPDGEKCACGQRGCLETYASAAALARRYAARTGDAATAKGIVERAASDGDAAAVLGDAVEALAISLASYTLLLDPSMIVIGGGLGEAGPALLDPLAERLAARLSFREPPPLRQSALGVRAGMMGAAILGWRAAGRTDWSPGLVGHGVGHGL